MLLKRRPLQLSLLAMALVGALGTPARASTFEVGCEELQATLNATVDGDVVTLTEMCVGMHFTLRTFRGITLQGAPEAGFDGNGTSGALLRGTDVEGTVIRNLVFRDGSAPDGSFATDQSGGAISLDGGSWPTIADSSFFSNEAPHGNGGAISIIASQSAGGVEATATISNNVFGGTAAESGNSARSMGGAVYVSTPGTFAVSGNTFLNNRAADGGGMHVTATGGSLLVSGNAFTENKALYLGGPCGDPEGCARLEVNGGGGAYVEGSGNIAITANVFRQNEVAPSDATIAVGGGLLLIPQAATVTQRGNLFVGNSIAVSDHFGGFAWGGGETVDFDDPADGSSPSSLVSRGDRFLGNSVSADEVAGGGLFLTSDRTSVLPQVTGVNTVVAGNSLAPGALVALGAGIAVTTEDSWACMDVSGSWTCGPGLNLRNATLSGNTAGEGGQGHQLSAGSQSPLNIHNSIVYGDGSTSDVSGLEAAEVAHTDLCFGGIAFPGTGNICANPRLKAPAAGDVRQTNTSPTRDLGSNADVPGDLSKDYLGDLRVIDSDANGSAIVDMGADEIKAPATVTINISRADSRLTLTGAVAPASPGKKVTITLMRKRADVFAAVGTKATLLEPDSRYTVSFRRPSAGTCKAKVSFAGSPTAQPASKTRTFAC